MSREQRARREIGVTSISRGSSLFLSLYFLSIIFVVPVAQMIIDGGDTIRAPVLSERDVIKQSLLTKTTFFNKEILRHIDQLEGDLEAESFLRNLFLPPLQYLFTRFLDQGNEKVIVGRNGQLLYRPAVDYLVGPPFLDRHQQFKRSEGHEIWEQPVEPDPLKAIFSFRDQLASRNIDLILLPVPVKASVRPGSLAGNAAGGPLANRSWNQFIQQLQENGVEVFDIRGHLYDFEKISGDAYLKTDTHWSPAAMKEIAIRLAEFLTGKYPDLSGERSFDYHQILHNGEGDLSRMLNFPEGIDLFAPAALEIEQVVTATGAYWQPDKTSPVLLLGDSFTNIYSAPGLEMGDGGGLAEQLSYYLLRSVDLLARNDDGAFITREMLATELARGRDRLAGKRVVVWQFAERELSFGNWKQVMLTLGTPRPTPFFTVDSGDRADVRATVAAVSYSPRPGTIPYRDNIVTIHLVDLDGEKVVELGGQALIYGFGMRDNKMTSLASLRPGDRVSMTLTSWEDREKEYGSYRRTSLDDEMIELEIPNWGEITDDTID